MEIGTRVNHKEFGNGTIIRILYEGTRRETFAIEFDVSNSKLHNCLGLTESNKGYFCSSKELEVI